MGCLSSYYIFYSKNLRNPARIPGTLENNFITVRENVGNSKPIPLWSCLWSQTFRNILQLRKMVAPLDVPETRLLQPWAELKMQRIQWGFDVPLCSRNSSSLFKALRWWASKRVTLLPSPNTFYSRTGEIITPSQYRGMYRICHVVF